MPSQGFSAAATLAVAPLDCELFSDRPELAYIKRRAYADRKPIGQVFTPFTVAQFMARWVAGASTTGPILDPALGLGVFFRALASLGSDSPFPLVAYETDRGVLDHAETLLTRLSRPVELRNADYLSSSWDDRYAGILCNPPYLKFHDYADRLALVREFSDHTGESFTGLTSLYSLFLVKSLRQLKTGGRAAYIVPAEFLNARYGTPIKKLLLASGALRWLVTVDFATPVFAEGTTTTAILLLEHGVATSSLSFARVTRLEELDVLGATIAKPGRAGRLEAANIKVLDSAALQPQAKWRRYYGGTIGESYRRLVPLHTFGKVSRGIATGDNGYFVMTPGDAQAHSLPPAVLQPCITKAVHATGPAFTIADFDQLRTANKPTYLFDGEAADTPEVRAYITLGEERGTAERYLTRHRAPWYALERRAPAPIWVTVFSRGGACGSFAIARWLRI